MQLFLCVEYHFVAFLKLLKLSLAFEYQFLITKLQIKFLKYFLHQHLLIYFYHNVIQSNSFYFHFLKLPYSASLKILKAINNIIHHFPLFPIHYYSILILSNIQLLKKNQPMLSFHVDQMHYHLNLMFQFLHLIQ